MEADKLTSTIGKGTSYISISVIITYFLGFFFKVFVAQTVGAEALGIVSLMMMMLGVFGVVFNFGLNQSMIKHISGFLGGGKDVRIVYSTGFRLVTFFALLGSGVLFVFSEYLALEVFNSAVAVFPFQLTAVALFFNLIQLFFRSCSKGHQRMENPAIANVTEKASKLVMAVLLVYLGFGVFGPVYSIVLSIVVGSVVSYVLFTRVDRFAFFGFDKKIAKMLLKFGVPVAVAGMSGMVLGWVDSFFVGVLMNVENVGFYSAAVSLYTFLGSLVGGFSGALFPSFSEIKARKEVKMLRAVLNRSLRYVFYLMFPASIGLFMLAEPVIRIIFGSEFYPAILPLQILVFGSLFLALSKVCTSFITGTGYPKTYTKYMVLSGVLNTILNVVLIPVYGLLGAAMATTVSLFILFALCLIFVYKKVGFDLGYVPKPVLAAVFMLLILYLIRVYLQVGTWGRIIAVVVLGTLSYFAVLYGLGGFDTRDKKIIRAVIRKIRKVFRV